jgi:hypothetical protein
MPRKKQAKRRTKKEIEQWFVDLYIKADAQEQHIERCEKRAHLKPGDGRKILRRKSVQAEIYRQLESVRAEQRHQATLTEAAAIAKAAVQRELSAGVSSIHRMKIDLEVLDHELMTMAVGLDKNTFPKEKLDAIKAAYVVFGTLESGNTRRLIPPEHLKQNEGQGTYASLFNRLALKSSPEPPQSQNSPSGEVFDLIPGQMQDGKQ